MPYHEDLRTPGIIPSLANSRKQIRHKPKSRIKPCLRPHLKQRFTARTGYFGVFFERAITDALAINNINYSFVIPGISRLISQNSHRLKSLLILIL